MNRPTPLSTATISLPNSISPSPLRLGLFLSALALAWFALSPTARAEDGAVGDGTSTAEGNSALAHLTTGVDNTATGLSALFSNTTGSGNTATGAGALVSNDTASANTATGFEALQFNTTGPDNTATGTNALQSNTSGGFNTANGVRALQNNTTGGANTANGFQALLKNTTGTNNTTNGVDALEFNTTGNNNTAHGAFALNQNTIGTGNTADGLGALNKNTTGSNNTALGLFAGQNLTTGSNNIDVGANVLGAASEANTIRVGKQGTQKQTFIAGISGVAVAGSTVVVNSSGKLGVATSSARFKQNIQAMEKASEAILALKPVTFRYKEDIDPDGILQFGLVAEEVEKVNPDLVARDDEGKPYTVRYEAVNAMLLNEFLKEHRKVEEQGATIAQQKKDFASELARQQKDFEEKFAQQQKQIEALTATVQKVSDQVAISEPAPQLVANP